MSDFENKDFDQQPVEPPYEKPTPHLTFDPNEGTSPTPPSYTSDPFQMPDPPRAPEPAYQSQPQQPEQTGQTGQPQYQPPQYQYQPPQYNQYQAPQYNYTPQYNTPPVGYAQKSRLAAGLLAIMLGIFGVHNFYLGFNTRGTIQLIVSLAGGLLTCGVATVAILVWAFIEGVMLLSAQPSRMYDANGVILRD